MNAQELREVFQLFDKDGNGSVTAKELGTVLRSLGQNPSDVELLDMVKYIKQLHEWNSSGGGGGGGMHSSGKLSSLALPSDAQGGGGGGEPPISQQLAETMVSFEMFSQFVGAKVREVEIEEELKAALRVFELPNRPGHILLSTLRVAVTSWGDRLTSDEVEEMIKDADASEDGVVVIEDFIRSIMLR